MKKGLGMKDMPRPFLFERVLPENRCEIFDCSRQLFMLSVRRSTLGDAAAWHNRPQSSWTGLALSVFFSNRVRQILKGADHGQGQDPKD
jgi:hypothetical protein